MAQRRKWMKVFSMGSGIRELMYDIKFRIKVKPFDPVAMDLFMLAGLNFISSIIIET